MAVALNTVSKWGYLVVKDPVEKSPNPPNSPLPSLLSGAHYILSVKWITGKRNWTAKMSFGLAVYIVMGDSWDSETWKKAAGNVTRKAAGLYPALKVSLKTFYKFHLSHSICVGKKDHTKIMKVKKALQLDLVVQACNPSCTGNQGRKITSCSPAWALCDSSREP